MEDLYSIYKITNTINNKVYIGLTVKSIEIRWVQHLQRAFLTKTLYKFYHAVRKHGKEKFNPEVICYCDSLNNANFIEQAFIEKYNSLKNGYNSTLGGDGTKGHKAWNKGLKNCYSEEHKRKLGEIRKNKYSGENHPRFGKKHSEESKKLMSVKLKGRVMSDATRKKMSIAERKPITEETRIKMGAASKGRCSFLGKKHSEETKSKMSLAAKGRKFSELATQKAKEANTGHIPWNKGKKMSVEYGKKLSNSLKGKPKSEAAKLNMKLGIAKMSLLQKKIAADKSKITKAKNKLKVN